MNRSLHRWFGLIAAALLTVLALSGALLSIFPAAEALTSVFGDKFSYTDTTELEFGINSRSFPSFRDAALETMNSRFYGGIHYRYSTIVSNKMGVEIGKLVADRLKMKK